MLIKNETKNTILSESAILAKSFKEKNFGLILEKKANAMIFQTRFGIHTFFMKYPIDILVLDKKNKVVALKKSLQPNRIFVWNIKYDLVIELPSETFERTKTKRGDKIFYNN